MLTGLGAASTPSSDQSLIPGAVRQQHGMTSRISDKRKSTVRNLLLRFWTDHRGQDIAEYAVMLAVILVLVVGTVRLVGSNANTAFSSVASSLQ